MKDPLNFREFYQKAPILIKRNDLLAIQKEAKYAKIFRQFTHWLIGVEGRFGGTSKFQWRVVIFPSYESGEFNCKFPFFKTPFLSSFDEALELLRKIELKAKKDELMKVTQHSF
ncbi:hypothetical protein [Bacillus dakarensis]|uniref:hypothetical protein n=1 Tax=Robertmurraya dakarensis TaxID=1926278 RepID=UPI000981BD84|nr:hypothetical protein [Bacillus dakarensis]